MFKKFRDPVSGLTHLIAAIIATVGLIFLLYHARDNTVKIISCLIYGISLILMFSASAAYHLTKASEKVILFLRKLDHSAIYLLIAGTYTPICMHYFTGFYRWGLLAIVWGIAVIGVAVKMFIINVPRWVNAGIYLLMGWLCILAIKPMLTAMPVGALVWLMVGGLFFTLGAIIYMTKIFNFYPGVFGFHEVWHIFVILGCLSHFIVILAYIASNGSPV
ncbi:MAG: hemolysin III family protein [Anaerolineales bacterium]|nr:hemolysin III family protein [Anaerolineales bacterium]